MNHPLLQTIANAAQTVFGASPEGLAILSLCRRTDEEWRDLERQREARSALIVITGHKNAGKSTLCRWLVNDTSVRAAIAAGTGRDGATRQMTWIGPEPPERIGADLYIPCPASAMADLGQSWHLADIPGTSDAHEPAREAARRMLRTAASVVVVSALDRVEEEAFHLREIDGARLLPVVVVDPGRVRDASLQEALELYRRTLSDYAPGSPLAEVLVIPRIDLLPQEEKEQATELAQQAFIKALREMLAESQPDFARLEAARLRVFHETLRRELGAFVERVGPRYRELIEAEGEVARKVVFSLLGSPREFHLGVRQRLFMQAVETTPRFFFPYHSFLGGLSLCAGAWDRLVFAGLGSIPSLAMLIWQTGRNIRDRATGQERKHHQLHERASALASESLAPKRQAFLRAVHQFQGREWTGTGSIPELEGLATVEAAVLTATEEGLEPPRRWLFFGAGFVSMLIWLPLALGPTLTIYHDFLKAWNKAIGPGPIGQWSLFPTPSMGMIFWSAILIFAPVMLLAAISLVLATRRTRVKRSADRIEANVRSALERLLESGAVQVRSGDPLEAAVRQLLHAARE